MKKLRPVPLVYNYFKHFITKNRKNDSRSRRFPVIFFG